MLEPMQPSMEADTAADQDMPAVQREGEMPADYASDELIIDREKVTYRVYVSRIFILLINQGK